MKNIFIENHKVIRAIGNSERVDVSIAVSYFGSNVLNAGNPAARFYGDENVWGMAKWSDLKPVLDQASHEQVGQWIGEYYAFADGK